MAQLASELLQDLADLSSDSDAPTKRPKFEETSVQPTEGLMALEAVEDELKSAFAELKSTFYPCFPELEELLVAPHEFAKVAACYAVSPSLRSTDIRSLVDKSTALGISVAAANSPGKPLDSSVRTAVLELVDIVIGLDDKRQVLQNSMDEEAERIAPNLCTLVGRSVAGRLITAAGGLRALAEMPSCNVQVLGTVRKHLGGKSTAAGHMSIISKAPVVTQLDLQWHKKTVRVLAGKISIAARVDQFKSKPDGSEGHRLRGLVEARMTKEQEPALLKKKPLPVPSELPKTHRGGKRVRAAKMRTQQTELSKHANRVPFGTEAQDEYRDTGHTFGMLHKTGQLKIKKAKHQKFKLSAQRRQQLSRGEAPLGMQSVFAFNQPNGLQLDYPEATFQGQQSKYFDNKSGFETVLADKRGC
jgi:U4/U6 small nuclear ribonucleoprotein PRP31